MGSVKIGVLGGTFNPIHLGHLHIARNIQALFSLSQVHFVVAAIPPHKRPEDLIPFTHRYAMVSLAIAEEPSFIPSLIELEPQASPYSIDTISKLSHNAGHDNAGIFFIAGGDSLREVKSWRESEKLLDSSNFIFVVRPGDKPIVLDDVLPDSAIARTIDLTGLSQTKMKRRIGEKEGNGNRIYLVDIGAPDISSTQIRFLVSSNESICSMVPAPVSKYINKLHLYGER